MGVFIILLGALSIYVGVTGNLGTFWNDIKTAHL